MNLLQAISAIPGVGPFLPYLVVFLAANALVVAPSLKAPASDGGAYGFTYRAVNLLAGNYLNAKNAGAAKAVPPIVVALLAVGLLGVLSACSPQQAASAQAANQKFITQLTAVNQALCQVDGQVQPVAVALAVPVVTATAPSAVPVVAGAVALDQTMIHPAIVAACAAIKGVPVAATPAVLAK